MKNSTIFKLADEPVYRLQNDSPAIDTGIADPSPTNDIEGNQRPCLAGVDMGALES